VSDDEAAEQLALADVGLSVAVVVGRSTEEVAGVAASSSAPAQAVSTNTVSASSDRGIPPTAGDLEIRTRRVSLATLMIPSLSISGIARARANADRSEEGEERPPSFVVGDVASMAFPDGSFDLVVSTLSMHHWAYPEAGLAEIGRVLRPGARALVWDFRAGPVPLHGHLRDPVEHAIGSPLRVVGATPMALAVAVQPAPTDRARARRRRA
jgi:SAM-dependent methyltransferase